MKKAFSLLLALVLCLSLCACGKDYSKHQFDFLGDDFSWDMTEEEAYEYISKHQLIRNEIEKTRYDTWTTITDDMYVFRFDKKGKIDFVKYYMGSDTGMVSILKEWYGEYDKYESKLDKYIWYGTMSGRNVEMTFYTITSSIDNDQCWLQFVLE